MIVVHYKTLFKAFLLTAVLAACDRPSVSELEREKVCLCSQVRAACQDVLQSTITMHVDDCNNARALCDSFLDLSGPTVKDELNQIIGAARAALGVSFHNQCRE